jgi:hypothetical protein
MNIPRTAPGRAAGTSAYTGAPGQPAEARKLVWQPVGRTRA